MVRNTANKGKHRRLRIWSRPGGVGQVWQIALPVFLSQAIDTLMVFTDRYFLAELGRAHLGATMAGGLAAILPGFFLVGMLGQVTAFVSQYLGARRQSECSRMTEQGIYLTLLVAPFLILGGLWLGPAGFRLAGHEGELLRLDLEYFNILILSMIPNGLRTAFIGFFTGLGRTKIVLAANAVGVAINIPLSYGLIFGKWGLPAAGIAGAAWATVFSGFVPVLILGALYYGPGYHREYQTRFFPRFSGERVRRLVRYGLPSGLENFFNLLAFTLFMAVLQSFSLDAAAAVAIILNWDVVSALPLMGIGQGTMSLVGRYKGAGKLKLARRAMGSGLLLAWSYGALVIFVFLVFTSDLTGLFSSSQSSLEYRRVYQLADAMLRISCLYIFFDGIYLVLSAAVRGAGDTRFALLASSGSIWLFSLVAVFVMRQGWTGPVESWAMIIIMVVLLALIFAWRVRSGRWERVKMI